MSDERELLRRTSEIAADFLESLDERRVFPHDSTEDVAEALGGPLPDGPSDPLEVLELMAREIDRGVVATAGGRYFGYVTGSALPATIAADWLTTIWDQCAGLGVLGPSASVVEEIAGDWLKEIFGLPADASFAVTTGCQMAHVTALAAARHHVLTQRGWDVREGGLAGSPPITVVVGDLRHVTVDRALRLLGIGSSQLVVVPADALGRMQPDGLRGALAGIEGPAIVCAQAGEVTPAPTTRSSRSWRSSARPTPGCTSTAPSGCGSAASPTRRHLVEGVAGGGLVGDRRPQVAERPVRLRAHVLRASRRAQRLDDDEGRRTSRARGSGSATRSTGRPSPHAARARSRSTRRFAPSVGAASPTSSTAAATSRSASRAGIEQLPGCTVLNDVVINQVLFRFEDDDDDAVACSRRCSEAARRGWAGRRWDGRAGDPHLRLELEDDRGGRRPHARGFRRAAAATGC